MKLNFSGHDTFALRQLWPYKAHQLIHQFKNPFTPLNVQESLKAVGIGKNMLKSIQFWIQAIELFKINNNEFEILPLGEIIFDTDLSMGNKYVGQFKNGKPEGKGTYYHNIGNKAGDIYIGEVSYTVKGSFMNPPQELRSLSKLRKLD